MGALDDLLLQQSLLSQNMVIAREVDKINERLNRMETRLTFGGTTEENRIDDLEEQHEEIVEQIDDLEEELEEIADEIEEDIEEAAETIEEAEESAADDIEESIEEIEPDTTLIHSEIVEPDPPEPEPEPEPKKSLFSGFLA